MARKLYIFNPTRRQRDETKPGVPLKWLGNYSTNYLFLGDAQARMLGVGQPMAARKVPSWLNVTAQDVRPIKGGASRLDKNFRGWG